jgi:hypothetical protein
MSVLTARFEALYSPFGRPSIPPEQLLRAMLLQAFYSIRSERQWMERLDFALSFRWFVGLGIDDAVWDHSTFSKNRDRLLDGDVAAGFLCAVLERPKVKRQAISGSPSSPKCSRTFREFSCAITQDLRGLVDQAENAQYPALHLRQRAFGRQEVGVQEGGEAGHRGRRARARR